MKVHPDAASALADVHDGITLMSGGFGLSGNAENAIRELARRGVRDLTVISNNIGNQGRGLAVLLKQRQIRRAVCSYVGGNPDLQAQMLAGEVEVELSPQGTFAERIRAGGVGLGGFFTPTGAGTLIAEGKEERIIDGRRYIFEAPLKADYAIIRAEVGDPFGNLRFKGTTRNFSPLMAMAARITVVEVDELVPLGALGPDDIHLPGIFVQRIFQGADYEDFIEYRTTRPHDEAG
ncbi:CoA transferase subunit A [Myxococcota bacterium]|nr:CoA transferase subunit A [Myxococcota bacterium]MBU1431054.1 CoA transferase subunit A [Myxococcota bacterium]MBU1897578.1 CoA transferase subunit A [Myxococcota bacterium]